MTDDYEPVTAGDLKPGDEVDLVLRGVIEQGGCFRTEKSQYLYGTATIGAAHTIRRKSRPIGVGDRVAWAHGENGSVLCVDDGEAWVKFGSYRAPILLSELTRMTP
jgi:hypothetical protein